MTPTDELDAPPKARKQRQPRRATAARLERVALHYLQRYSASSARLRRVLLRRVDRSAKVHGTDPAQGRGWVDQLVERFERAGLLDDARFAENKAGALLRAGKSMRAVSARLRTQGIAPEQIARTLEKVREETVDPDLEAARTLARKRKLGPHRPADLRKERREKDLAVLARAGFRFSVAKQVIDGDA